MIRLRWSKTPEGTGGCPPVYLYGHRELSPGSKLAMGAEWQWQRAWSVWVEKPLRDGRGSLREPAASCQWHALISYHISNGHC